VKIALGEICTNQGFKSLVCKEGVSHEFLYYLLLTLKPQMLERAIGSTFLEIGKRDIASISTDFPDTDEQTAIATVLSDMDAEIAALERRRDKTSAIKQGMMQQLLTGRVRLVEFVSGYVKAQPTVVEKASSSHSWAFNEAVIIATLAKHFGNEAFPLGRKRYTKLSYLLHRHVERQADGYLKKAAGPYNPKTKYGGPERIAIERRYVRSHKHGRYTGFVAADAVDQAENYFERWYGADAIQWLEQFRFLKNDELELLATVDMAAEELRASGRDVDVATVKGVIGSHPEWEAKLDRTTFSDANIGRAINRAGELLGNGGQR
jgi:type I restriction enzyme S subunit